MDRIKQQVDQIQQQLAGLSASQKMLTATLVAIMIATVVWWTRYAATGEMVAVMDQALTAEEMNPMTDVLTSRGIAYVIDGDRLLVSASDRERAFSMISSERALPRDTTNHFSSAVKAIGAFDSTSKINMLAKDALQQEFSDVISGWKNVRSAKVFVNTEYKRQIGGDLMPGASIVIATDGNVDKPLLAAAAADLVRGPVPMLSLENITVTIDRAPVRLDTDDSFLNGGSDYLALKSKGSEHYGNRVRQLLGHIPGLQVVVDVDVNDEVLRQLEYQVGEETLQIPKRETTTTESSREGGEGGEPGLGMNVQTSIAARGAGRTEESEKTESENIADYDRVRKESMRDKGATTPTTCSLSIPMSYVISEWKQRTRTQEEPEASVFEAYEQQVFQTLKNQVSNALGGIDPTRIACMTYYDAAFADGNALAGTGIAGPGGDVEKSAISGLIRNYGKEAAVAALAMVSLFLVSTMVKKSAPMAITGGGYDGDPLALIGGDEMAGVAAGTGGLMVAQEVSDDAVQAGQVLEQVQALVKENPDAAAALVKRWLNAG